jgi:hypothetical protein
VRSSEVTSSLLQIFGSEDGETGKILPKYPRNQLHPLKCKKFKKSGYSQRSVIIYQTIRCHILDGRNPYIDFMLPLLMELRNTDLKNLELEWI